MVTLSRDHTSLLTSKRATRILESLHDNSYSKRLHILGLPTLKYRRLRGDTILLNRLINNDICTISSVTLTRGHMYNLQKPHSTRCNFFSLELEQLTVGMDLSFFDIILICIIRKEGEACYTLSIQCSIIGKKLFKKKIIQIVQKENHPNCSKRKSSKLFLNSLRDLAVTTCSAW